MNNDTFKTKTGAIVLALGGSFLSACDTTPRQMVDNTSRAVANTISSVSNSQNDGLPNFRLPSSEQRSTAPGVYVDQRGIQRNPDGSAVVIPGNPCKELAFAERQSRASSNTAQRIAEQAARDSQRAATRGGSGVAGNILRPIIGGAVATGAQATGNAVGRSLNENTVEVLNQQCNQNKVAEAEAKGAARDFRDAQRGSGQLFTQCVSDQQRAVNAETGQRYSAAESIIACKKALNIQ